MIVPTTRFAIGSADERLYSREERRRRVLRDRLRDDVVSPRRGDVVLGAPVDRQVDLRDQPAERGALVTSAVAIVQMYGAACGR